LLLFALLTGAFEASRGTMFESVLVDKAVLSPTVFLINVVTPREHAVLADRTISSAGSRLHVTRGCEGIEMFLMLIAAIAAFPASLLQRAHGLAAGAGIAYVLAVGRLMALHYVLRYSPTAWEALHGVVLPLGPILIMAIYFLRWSAGAVPPAVTPPLGTHAA